MTAEPPGPPPEPPRPPTGAPGRTPRRRVLADRIARWGVTAGGIGIIASILAILIFIFIEVWPLTRGAAVTRGRIVDLEAGSVEALVGDEYRTHVVGLGRDGEIRAFRTSDGRRLAPRAQGPAESGESLPPLESVAAPPGGALLAGSTADGRIVTVPVSFAVEFADGQRTVVPELGAPVGFVLDPDGGPVQPFAVHLAPDGTAVAAGQLADGRLAVVRREVTRNLLTGEVTESFHRQTMAIPQALTHLRVDELHRNLYGATGGGELLWWRLRDGRPGELQAVSAGPSPVTALSLLLGHRSLVVGQADGSLSVWFPVPQAGGGARLTRIRSFPAHRAAVVLLAPSLRTKGFLAQDAAGAMGLYHSTSHRVLWQGPSPLPGAAALTYSPKGDGAFLAGNGKLAGLDIRNPHPEVSWQALFGKVWYEGYEEPDHVWQSTGGGDDFEPKLSLTPLLVGTLKGTLYALILAIPLAILGAMFASQFMHPSLLRYVKPTVEIMAALPTVVLGFIAGLWLAPRLEQAFSSLILMAVVLPALVLLAGALWKGIPRRLRDRLPTGSEVVLFVIALAAGLWLCLELSGPFEVAAFGGSFQSWLLETTGLRYDQRNAIVVGLAMGFAVIPIIFAISEDALSNVPRELISGSLALGANRWQTVTRVVLPTASPGIFSAVMVGFGRAVGETMIVLMATGNTPVMSWSPFEGFRTLSANIAVEIPEAPQYGTLYRVLFLAALLLFVLTFLVNTAAELVRQRLRRRYAQL